MSTIEIHNPEDFETLFAKLKDHVYAEDCKVNGATHYKAKEHKDAALQYLYSFKMKFDELKKIKNEGGKKSLRNDQAGE